MVRAPCFHCRGYGFDPWSGNLDPISRMAQPKKKLKKKTKKMFLLSEFLTVGMATAALPRCTMERFQEVHVEMRGSWTRPHRQCPGGNRAGRCDEEPSNCGGNWEFEV